MKTPPKCLFDVYSDLLATFNRDKTTYRGDDLVTAMYKIDLLDERLRMSICGKDDLGKCGVRP